MKSKIKRIGFDLDGVIIDKPPIIPRRLLEAIYRGNTNTKKLVYRFPKSALEIKIRQLSHHPVLRPLIKEQIDLIQKLHKSKRFKMFAVTSRYSFLKERTCEWFSYYDLNGLFEKIYINEKDQQPHVFKEKVIKKLKLDIFIDDDRSLLDHLKKKVKGVEFIFVEDSKNGLKKLLKQ